jgi:CHASE2 domain-containing sensor protein/nitrogen-specific signal transduction histidine kinase
VATPVAPGPTARRPLPSRAAIEWWLLASVLVALVLVVAHASRQPSGQAVSRLDAVLYDLGLALWAKPPRDEVLIVAIDDDSLAQVGRWPWRRPVTALLLERLQAAGPRVIGVDLLLTEPAVGDERIGAAAAGPAPVVLPIAREADPQGDGAPLLPVPAIGSGRALAHVEFRIDVDGLVRGLYLTEGGFPAMARRLAFPELPQLATQDAVAGMLRNAAWSRADYVRIGATDSPVRQVSAAAVMRGDVPVEVIRDRIVLIGATARGLGDVHATTLYPGHATVPGVELHAAAVGAMLDGRLIRDAPHGLRLAVSAAVLLAVLAALYATEPRTGLACVAVAMTLSAAAAIAAIGAGWWLAPGALLAVLGLAFPLWSWRRLHAASVGLIAQATRLEADAVPDPAAGQRRPIEPIAQRLQRLEHAAERITVLNRTLADALSTLQAAQRDREQMLRFLSHDLRSPHLSILGLLERHPDGPLDAGAAGEIGRQSRRALELTDGFMHLARAESQPLRDAPHDLADLAIEAADACWARAHAAGLRIDSPAPPDDTPVAPCRCDAGLVRRALVNLLDNALRVAPAGSVITLGLARDGAGWTLSVSDRGPGIAVADRERIFEPWWRGPQADPSSGAGLGLAFVATVAERHGGGVRALAAPENGARIELWLPDEPLSAAPG